MMAGGLGKWPRRPPGGARAAPSKGTARRGVIGSDGGAWGRPGHSIMPPIRWRRGDEFN